MCKTLSIAILALCVFALSACGSTAATGNPTITSAPASTVSPAWKITIEGSGQPVALSAQDLEKIGKVTIKAAMKDKDTAGPEEEWTGVPLAKALEYLKVGQYTTIKVESSDGYAKEYTPDLVESAGTILGTELGGKALDRDRGPVQLVVNGKGSNWWIKQVVKITVIK